MLKSNIARSQHVRTLLRYSLNRSFHSLPASYPRQYSSTSPTSTVSESTPPLSYDPSNSPISQYPSSFPQYDIPSTNTPSSLHLPHLSGNFHIAPTDDPYHATRFEDHNEKLLDSSIDYDSDYLVPRMSTSTDWFQEIHSASPLGHTMTITPEQSATLAKKSADAAPLFKPDADVISSLEFTFACSGHVYHYPSEHHINSRDTIISTLPTDLFKGVGANLPLSINNGSTTSVVMKRTAEGSESTPSPLINEYGVEAFDKLKIGDMISMACGEDSVLGSTQLLGLADGVSGWCELTGGHAALWSRLILHRVLSHYVQHYNSETREGPVPELKEILDSAFVDAKEILDLKKETGSSTLILASLNASQDTLQVVNIGDSSIYVIRDGEIVFTATHESTPEKNCPHQIGTNSTEIPSSFASVYTIPVQEDDLILMCSDGVSDNLWENEITDILDKQYYSNNSETDLKTVTNALVNEAIGRSFDNFAVCPYQLKSSSSSGGKTDDISVLLAKVVAS